jgi:hypothetical protein
MQQVDIARLERERPTASTCAAEILVVGAEDWAIDDAASQLQAAGRHVYRCSETTEAPFPCNALIPGRGCPLDQFRIDVVVNIRSRPESQPSLAEMGAICGLRDRIPLVVAGMSGVSGLTPWAVRVPPEGDIVTTCDEAVRERDAAVAAGAGMQSVQDGRGHRALDAVVSAHPAQEGDAPDAFA